MLLDPEKIVPSIPTIAAQLLNVVYERVAMTGGDPQSAHPEKTEGKV